MRTVRTSSKGEDEAHFILSLPPHLLELDHERHYIEDYLKARYLPFLEGHEEHALLLHLLEPAVRNDVARAEPVTMRGGGANVPC